MEGGKIPGWARVRHPKPTFDLENRRADLVCDQGLMSFEGLFITGKDASLLSVMILCHTIGIMICAGARWLVVQQSHPGIAKQHNLCRKLCIVTGFVRIVVRENCLYTLYFSSVVPTNTPSSTGICMSYPAHGAYLIQRHSIAGIGICPRQLVLFPTFTMTIMLCE